MIEKILEDYKNITEEIINNINNDEEAIKLMEKREELIKSLFENKDEKEKILEIYLAKNLLDLDNKLKILIEEEQVKVKEEIRSLHKMKSANNIYEKNRKINSFFCTKV